MGNARWRRDWAQRKILQAKVNCVIAVLGHIWVSLSSLFSQAHSSALLPLQVVESPEPRSEEGRLP